MKPVNRVFSEKCYGGVWQEKM